MRDYISHKVQDISKLIDDLRRQEQNADEARRQRNSQQRTEAEGRARAIREQLLVEAPPAVSYEFVDVTRIANATSLRTTWQEKNRSVDCLQPLFKNWKEGRSYFQIFAAPAIDLSLLPAYSFVIQLTFALAQPYISRDEQNFYIIDNPVRKDKLFGLPYVASTSWKGSLRSASRHMKYKEESDEDKKEKATIMLHLFGNEKNIEDV